MCGQEAADRYCKSQGHVSLSSHGSLTGANAVTVLGVNSAQNTDCAVGGGALPACNTFDFIECCGA
jgi:hypothetical protein